MDGIEIVGYMDGVRIVNRLKKKLETEVDLYCSGQSLESGPKDGAHTKQESSLSMWSNSGLEADGLPEAEVSRFDGATWTYL